VSTARIQITAGNEPPVLKAEITGGNKTFYFPATPVKYAVQVSDKEDGNTTDGSIKPGDVMVSFDYLKGFDMTGIAQGHQQAIAEAPGKTLIGKSDCKSCHLIDQRSAGPSYQEVAKKYKGQKGATDQLAAKIIKGGSGVWGETEMAAHPQISVEDAKKMVDYIMTLGEPKAASKLPLTGTVTPGNEEDGAYLLTASYSDKGANNVPVLSSSALVVLRSPMLTPDQASDLNIARVLWYEGRPGLENIKNNAHAGFKDIDLTGIKTITVMTFMMPGQATGEVELHLDKPDGKLLGKVNAKNQGMSTTTIKPEVTDGVHSIYAVFKNPQAGDKDLFYFVGLKLGNR
jgi:cytochrome c